MDATTFTALAERAGRWWTVRIPQIEGLAVQVRSLDQAEMMARQRIAEALRVPPESIRVEVRTDASVLPAVTAALQARQAAMRAAEAAAQATLAAIEELLAEGTPFQEATVLLGLSPEEIAHFAGGAAPRALAPESPGASLRSAEDARGPRGPRGPRQPERPPERPPVGPGGLPQRTRLSGPLAIHH